MNHNAFSRQERRWLSRISSSVSYGFLVSAAAVAFNIPLFSDFSSLKLSAFLDAGESDRVFKVFAVNLAEPLLRVGHSELSNSKGQVLYSRAPGAVAMHIQNTTNLSQDGCFSVTKDSDGWEPYQSERRDWRLNRANGQARVTVHYMGQEGAITCATDTIAVDTQPPQQPEEMTVTLDNESQGLTVQWPEVTDEQTGLRGYQLAVGSSPGGSEILDWQEVGPRTLEFRFPPEQLPLDQEIWIALRAIDAVGNTTPHTLYRTTFARRSHVKSTASASRF